MHDTSTNTDGSSSHTCQEHQVYERIFRQASSSEFDTRQKRGSRPKFDTWFTFGVSVVLDFQDIISTTSLHKVYKCFFSHYLHLCCDTKTRSDHKNEPFGNCLLSEDSSVFKWRKVKKVKVNPAHLNVEQCGSVSLPLLHQTHVLDHGLLLVHALQFLPLVHHAGLHRRRLFSHPRLQAVLLLQLLPTHGAAPEAPPQSSLQEAGALSLGRPRPLSHRTGSRGEGFGWVLNPGPQARHGEHLRHLREADLGVVVSQEVLEPEGSQELQSLLWGRILSTDDRLMSLKEAENTQQNARSTSEPLVYMDKASPELIQLFYLLEHEGELHAVFGNTFRV